MTTLSQKSLLGPNITMFRKRLGFTTAEIAESIGMSRTSLRDIEQGITKSPSFTNVVRLSRVFGVEPVKLYKEDLSDVSDRDLAIRYINTNYNEQDWRYLLNVVYGKRKDQMNFGYFASIHSTPEMNQNDGSQ